MKRMALFAALLAFAGCGGIGIPDFAPLSSRQPRVVSVEPTDGAEVTPGAMVAIEFSEQIDEASVDPSTLAIVPADVGDDDVVDIGTAVVDGDVRGIDGVYEFAGEGRVAIFRPLSPYTPGAGYKVVATSGIVSLEMLPLAAQPGKAKGAFVSAFVVAGTSVAENAGGSGGAAGGGGSSGGGSAESTVVRPETLVINEALYDIPGDDTNGVLFVELSGDPGASIGGYKILFINGDDGQTTEEIAIPKSATIPDDGIFLIADSKTGQGGATFVAGADVIDNFDPQNGPDCVQLLDDKGALIDALGYGLPIASPAANALECFEGTPAAKPPAGSSLSRTDGLDTDDNAADFRTPAAPTPGVL